MAEYEYEVTLSMPIYNVASYVERALLSALNQTFESIEFLLVDDRGIDNSMEIVHTIISGHTREKDIRIIEHKKNIGLGATRNTAIDNAKGRYLFFMDSDDEITSDCIDIMYSKIVKNNVDFVAGSYNVINCVGEVEEIMKYNDCFLYDSNIISLYIKDRQKIFTPIWNKLYSIDFLRRNKVYCIPYCLNEDILFLLHVMLKASSCILISNVSLSYFLRDNSITGVIRKGIDDKLVKQHIDIFREMQYLLNQNKNNIVYIYGYMLSFVFSEMITILSSDVFLNTSKKLYINKFSFDIDLSSLIKLFRNNIKYIFEYLFIKSSFPVKCFLVILFKCRMKF